MDANVIERLSALFGMNTSDMSWRELDASRWRRAMFCALLMVSGFLATFVAANL